MAKAKDKPAVLVEFPIADVGVSQHQVYIEGYVTARQYRALSSIGGGLNGSMGVFAKAGGKLKNIHIVRCILETIADAMDEAMPVSAASASSETAHR